MGEPQELNNTPAVLEGLSNKRYLFTKKIFAPKNQIKKEA